MRKALLVCGMSAVLLGSGMPLLGMAQEAKKQITAEELAKATPSGTVEIQAEQLRLIIGGGSGKGVLTFEGKKYPFTFKAGSVGGVGAAKSVAVGNVYFLKKIEDFPGKYSAVTAGLTPGKGAIASSYENDKGVYVSLRSKTEGLAMSLGINVANVELTK